MVPAEEQVPLEEPELPEELEVEPVAGGAALAAAGEVTGEAATEGAAAAGAAAEGAAAAGAATEGAAEAPPDEAPLGAAAA